MASRTTPDDRLGAAQRATLLALVPLTALLFIRGTVDAFSVVKAVVLELGALAIVILGAARMVLAGRAPAWARPNAPELTAGILALALVLATATSRAPSISVWGFYPRSTGLLLYVACLVCWLAARRVLDGGARALLLRCTAVTSLPVAAYGIVQAAGLDPLTWDEFDFPGVFSTLGNPNFLAAFCGVVAPLCAAAAWGARERRWQVVGVLSAVGAVVASVLTRSAQGPVTVVIGLASLGALVLAARRRGGPGLGAAGRIGMVTVAAALVVAAVVVGPGLLDQGLRERRILYAEATAQYLDSPVLGVGLDTFGRDFLRRRPVEHAALAGRVTADSVHSVPLSMAFGGGTVLALAYLAFVAATGWALLRALRRPDVDAVVLSGIGGGWIAYQVQSLISIEVAPLAVLHFVLAGAIAAAAWPRPTSAAPSTRRRAAPTAAVALAAVVVAVAGLAGAWTVSRPLRAEFAVGRAATAAAAGDLHAALAAFERSHELAPRNGEYRLAHASVLQQAGDLEGALAQLEIAVDVDTASPSYALAGAVAAEALGRPDRAAELYATALEIDPLNPDVLAVVGRATADAGEIDEGLALVEQATEIAPDDPELLVSLGEVYRLAGRDADARTAFEAALALDSEAPGAREGLDGLAGA